jgi:hypothetical protein
MERVHVIPINDLRPHEESLACPCRPRRNVGQPNVVVHNSFDGREIVERAADYAEAGVN